MNIRLVVTIVLAIGLAAAVMAADQTDKLPASGGDITIAPIMHSSVQIEYAGKVIQVDPGFATDPAIPPGMSQFAFSFQARWGASFPRLCPPGTVHGVFPQGHGCGPIPVSRRLK